MPPLSCIEAMLPAGGPPALPANALNDAEQLVGFSMSQKLPSLLATRLVCFVVLLVACWPMPAVKAQGNSDVTELKERAARLLEQLNYIDALPLLEKLSELEPDNPRTHFLLASALFGQAANAKEESAKKALRIRSRNEFLKAKQLGINEPNIDALIKAIPADGSFTFAYSTNAKADELMKEGEALFTQGKLDDALKHYQAALALDPTLYNAALFAGDVLLQKLDFTQAEVWFQKAITIDPDRETAYRYSADSFMKQGKTKAARDRYIEAFITEPYNSFPRAALGRWGQSTHSKLSHPAIEIPASVTFDEKGNARINLETSATLGKDEGGAAWVMYGITRTAWRKEKFAQTYPNEKAYRHSLAEEADALRGVVTFAYADGKQPTNSTLINLKKLSDEGLLESYILLGRTNPGIAKDHLAYLRENREKLRRYVTEYVVTGGGQ